jgi:maltose-binding protein MalE
MLLGGTYEWPRIRDESDWTEEEDAVAHLGFVPIPRPSVDVPQVGSLGGTSWAILQQSPARELCMEILKLACAPETLRSFCEEHLQISPNRAVNEQLCTADHPWLSTIIPLLRLGRPRPLLSNYLQVSRFVQDMLEQVLWEGAPPEETIRRTAQSLALLSGT